MASVNKNTTYYTLVSRTMSSRQDMFGAKTFNKLYCRPKLMTF